MATLRQRLGELIEKLEPETERAFLEAIEDIKSEIILREIVERLERQDIEGAIEALHIEPSAFRPLSEALRQAFNQGGILTIQNMPRLSDPMGGRVVLRWNTQNQRAEAIIRELSSTAITNITEDTRQMVREKIEAGYALGQGPRAIAVGIAGRMNRITKTLEGGLLGVTAQRARTIEKARVALLTGDVEGMKHYLTLSRRDKRFDRTIVRAIQEKQALQPDQVSRVIATLRDRYVRARAELIARTETMTSVMAAKHEAYQQGLDAAGRDASLVTRKWRSAGDRRVRHTHMVMNGQVVQGMDLAFQSPSGAMLRYPGDRSLGAGANEIIACRCDVEYSFDFAEAYARSRGR
jgi:uncharacterized protein YceH (UPF0502 family)